MSNKTYLSSLLEPADDNAMGIAIENGIVLHEAAVIEAQLLTGRFVQVTGILTFPDGTTQTTAAGSGGLPQVIDCGTF